MSLLIVGTLAFDSIETPFGKAEKIIGGAATYIAWAASYFCHDIRLISIIGDDFPKEEITALANRGVDTNGLKIVSGGKSFYWAGKYSDNLSRRDTLITELNVLSEFDPVLPELYRTSDCLMLGNLTPDIQLQVMRQMKRRPRIITLDTMNYWMDTTWKDLLKALKQVDILSINDEEARQLSGEYSLAKAAKVIFSLGPKYLVIKKGEHGAFLFHQDHVFFAPALPLLEIQDPTGAGDSFAGGFMGYLANRKDQEFNTIKQAIICGSAMASFCVEAFGLDKLKNITGEELEQRVMQFREIVHVDF